METTQQLAKLPSTKNEVTSKDVDFGYLVHVMVKHDKNVDLLNHYNLSPYGWRRLEPKTVLKALGLDGLISTLIPAKGFMTKHLMPYGTTRAVLGVLEDRMMDHRSKLLPDGAFLEVRTCAYVMNTIVQVAEVGEVPSLVETAERPIFLDEGGRILT